MFDRYKKSFPAKLSLYVISFITILSFVLVGVFYHYSTETLSQEAEDKIESMKNLSKKLTGKKIRDEMRKRKEIPGYPDQQ